MYFLIKSCLLLFDSSACYLEVFISIYDESEQFLTLFKTSIILLENIEVCEFEKITTQEEFDKHLEQSLSKLKVL